MKGSGIWVNTQTCTIKVDSIYLQFKLMGETGREKMASVSVKLWNLEGCESQALCANDNAAAKAEKSMSHIMFYTFSCEQQ